MVSQYTSVKQAEIIKTQCSFSGRHYIQMSKVVQIDGENTQTIVSARRKQPHARTRWQVGIESQGDHRQSQKCRGSKDRRDSAISGTLFTPQLVNQTRYPRVNILNLDMFIALAWTLPPRSERPPVKQEVRIHNHNGAKKFYVLRMRPTILRFERGPQTTHSL